MTAKADKFLFPIEAVEAAEHYVRDTATQQFCPIRNSNCEPRCVAFSITQTQSQIVAKCAHLKVEVCARKIT